jgi:hypothetical protein
MTVSNRVVGAREQAAVGLLHTATKVIVQLRGNYTISSYTNGGSFSSVAPATVVSSAKSSTGQGCRL